MDDQKIYQRQELLEIYKNPVNREQMSNPDVSVFEKNVMCGDELNLDLKIKDNVVVEAKYHGPACAVSVISSSLFTEDITGKSIDEIKSYTKDDILELVGVDLTTSRVKCATLILDAFQKALNEYDKR